MIMCVFDNVADYKKTFQEKKKSAEPPPPPPRTTKALFSADNKEFTLEIRDASPAHLMTEIKSFSMLSKNMIWKIESMEFEAGDYKWKLLFYPDGRERENEGDDFNSRYSLFSPFIANLVILRPDRLFREEGGPHISVYLSMVGTTSLPAGWEVNAFFNFFLYNHISDNYLCFRGKTRRFHAVNSEWGYSKLISKKYLTDPSNGFVFNDNCVFGAEVFVIKKQRVVERVSVLDAKNTDPYKRHWEISEFSKQGDTWASELFFAGGYNWKVTLNPNGDSRERGGYVSIFLVCVDSNSFAPHKKVYATCLFRLVNKLPATNSNRSLIGRGWFKSSVSAWGFNEFIAVGDMQDPSKGFVVDDSCHLEIMLYVLAQHEALQLEE